MPYINLLPPEDRRQGMNLKRGLIFAGVLVYLLILSGIYLINYTQVSQLREDYLSLESRVTMIQPTLKQIQTMEEERQKLSKRLRKGQSLDQEIYFSKLLVWLGQQIPAQVTLSRMNFGEGKFAFEGEAEDYSSIATFIEGIKDSEYFADVELIASFSNPNSEQAIGFKVSAELKIKG